MSFLRVLKIVAGWLLGAFIVLNFLAFANGLLGEAVARLLVGWTSFISRNIQSATLDSDIFISGLIAGIVALATLHFLIRWLSKHFKFKWTIGSTVSVFGFIIVLFATSFLVPGFLTVGKLMLSEPWVNRSRSTEDYLYRNQLHKLKWSILEADMTSDDQLATWDIDSLITGSSLANSKSFKNGFADSGFLYPAAGLHPIDHEHLPLFISPEYLKRGKPVRRVVFSDSSIEYINPQQVEELLKRVAEIHKRTHKGNQPTSN